ncbi:hypothetical protein [Microbispora sp. H10670]|uniref:hypothetical protein n=1 Tax=Microbispora sp. H10670 TaxID=2729108 RepID=UPI001603F808|nr:hypothetical protein [Microbispora sp. H10670]
MSHRPSVPTPGAASTTRHLNRDATRHVTRGAARHVMRLGITHVTGLGATVPCPAL